MNKRARRELIVKTTLEVLQNVLPTNIMENLDKLNADDDSDDFTDNLDEEKFFYEQLVRKVPNEPEVPIVSNELSASSVSKQPKHSKRPKNVASTEPVDNNASLTYFDIVEQEMILSLPVTKANLELLSQILEGFDEINADLLTKLNLQTLGQVTNLLVYALMTADKSKKTEETLCLEPGTVNKVLQTLCEIIAQKKDAFIHWPNKREIERSVRRFENYQEYGHFEFYNVFGAIGTVEIRLKPQIPNYLAIAGTNNKNTKYTPIKWQCSCDTSGILQSSLVLIPKIEKESKNSYVFEVNPVKQKLETMKLDEVYLVADETLTIFPFLLTPHEKIIIRSEDHNIALESKRKVVDKMFEKIIDRFSVLKRIELRDAESIQNVVDTVGVLHNFFMIHNDRQYIAE